MDGCIRTGCAAHVAMVVGCRKGMVKAVPIVLGGVIGTAALTLDSGVRAQALELAQELPAIVEPGRIEKEFEENELPQSTFEPMVPEGEESVSPSEAEDILFVLSGVMVDEATAYSEVDFLPLYEPLLPFHQSGEQY